MTIRPFSTIEIVGLSDGGFGRTCGIHSTNCGVSVKVDTNLKLIKSTIEVPLIEKIPVVSEENTEIKKRGRPKKKETQFEEVFTTEVVECIKAFIWINGVEGCFVGFVSKPFLKLYGSELDGRVVHIVTVGWDSDVEADRRRSLEHNGLVSGVIIA
jgi:hypothetical protein